MKAILCFAFVSLMLSICPRTVEVRRIYDTPFKWNHLPSHWKKREFTNERQNKQDFQRSNELSRLDKVERNFFQPPNFPRPGN
ncbi:hypothetical protein AWC38_SpisGene9665 [Stylophora pistillata]|uniref:Uncharacterized protein n=1 Tax=Stylophora pistillata TaxID=50429 RepID=A0A2B4S6Y9_STYPI|nr:hypothetical protein AWC38_SpisGene9665 [Stylophora pistillata]